MKIDLKHRLICLTLLIAGLVIAVHPAMADHDDSTPQGVRITVTSVNAATGMVDFDVTLVDSDNDYEVNTPFTVNGNAFLGQRFYLNNELPRTTLPSRGNSSYSQAVFEATALPPGIDFGDGETVPFTQLALDSSTFISTSARGSLPQGRTVATFRGSFSHTYATPGDYTIRVFASSAFEIPTSNATTTLERGGNNITTGNLTTGNGVGTGVYVLATDLNEVDTRTLNGQTTETGAYGITNTAQVSFGSVLDVPTVGEWGLLLLGLLIGAGGFLVIRSSK